MKSWIYKLSKEKLVGIANLYGVESSGTLDEVRRQMNAYIDEHPEEFACKRGEALVPPLISMATLEPRGGTVFSVPESPDDDGRVMDKIRKWGCHFDGRDPAAFLERIHELQNSYRISGAQLLRGLPEILKGNALLWYRNFYGGWRTWTDFETAFRRYYFPRRYAASLRRKVANRYQLPEEKFEPYAAAKLTLLRQAGGFTPEEQLELIYDHMRPEYKRYIRLDDVVDIIELLGRATEHEEIEQGIADEKKRRKSVVNPTVYRGRIQSTGMLLAM